MSRSLMVRVGEGLPLVAKAGKAAIGVVRPGTAEPTGSHWVLAVDRALGAGVEADGHSIVVGRVKDTAAPSMVVASVASAAHAAAHCQRLDRKPPATPEQLAAGNGPNPPSSPPRPLFEVITNPDAKPLAPSDDADDAVVLIEPGCLLDPLAPAVALAALRQNPELDLVYGDSVVSTVDGDRLELRPGFSPDRLSHQQYLGGVVIVRRRLWDEVASRARPGAHRIGVAGPALDGGGHTGVDRLVTLAENARLVGHIPRPLYRRAAADGPVEWDEASDIVARQPRVVVPDAGCDRRYDASSVSIVIPTNGARRKIRDREEHLVIKAVTSVIDSRAGRSGAVSTSVGPVEIVVVTTPGTDDETRSELDRMGLVGQQHGVRVRVISDDRPFNFSNVCNRGASVATGELLVFLNDDTEIITGDWLERLSAWTAADGIGAVGVRLYYEDGTIQHNGLWSRGGHPVHRYEGADPACRGHLGSLLAPQNCLAVTGACLAVRRSKFETVGGFSPLFPSSYNDVDLCLKLLDRGHRTVIDPAIQLYHFEASSRDPSISDSDMARLHDRWRPILNHDPFDNPNHTAPGSEEIPVPAAGTIDPLGPDDVAQPLVRTWPLSPVVAEDPPMG